MNISKEEGYRRAFLSSDLLILEILPELYPNQKLFYLLLEDFHIFERFVMENLFSNL
jgi:hypothetical protein